MQVMLSCYVTALAILTSDALCGACKFNVKLRALPGCSGYFAQCYEVQVGWIIVD